MAKILLPLLFFLFATSIFSKQKTVKLEELKGNFRKAKSALIEVNGDISEILYSGNSIRFAVEGPGGPVAVDSYHEGLIKSARIGNKIRVCGIFLKYKKYKYKGKKTNLPVILSEKPDCP